MLDSAHETISALKAEVSDLSAELDDARRALEEVEAGAMRQAEADAQEKANLRWVGGFSSLRRARPPSLEL